MKRTQFDMALAVVVIAGTFTGYTQELTGPPVNAPITVTVHGGGDNIEAQVMRAMKNSTSRLIEQLKRAEREDFRRAIV